MEPIPIHTHPIYRRKHDEFKSIKMYKNRSPYVELPTQLLVNFVLRVGFCLIKQDNEQWIKAFGPMYIGSFRLCAYIRV